MLAEADLDMTRRAMEQAGNTRDTSGLYARFYLHPKKDEKASIEEGRPIFCETPYIEIRVPGDKGTVINRPVRDRDRAEFPKQWAAFEAGAEQGVDGTPLEEWPMVTRAQVEELRFFGVRSVEQLAQMADSNAQKFMAIGALREKARLYMEAAKGNAPLAKLKNENDQLRGELDALKDQMKELAKQMPATRRRKQASTDTEE